MLVLTRRRGESIVVSVPGGPERARQQIVIRVLRLRGRGVRLGIEAAADVAVRRGELEPVRRPSVEA